MARTTATLVKAVLAPGQDYDLDRNPSLDPSIDAANLVVTRVVACAIARGRALTTEEATTLETWLAAHCYMMSDQQTSSRSTAGSSGSFRASGGLNLDGSTYGQTARDLIDPSGCLATIATRARARVVSLGKRASERVRIWDRN